MTEYLSIYKKTKEFITDNLSQYAKSDSIDKFEIKTGGFPKDTHFKEGMSYNVSLVAATQRKLPKIGHEKFYTVVNVIEPCLFLQGVKTFDIKGGHEDKFLTMAKEHTEPQVYDVFYKNLRPEDIRNGPPPNTVNETVTIFELLKNKGLLKPNVKNVSIVTNYNESNPIHMNLYRVVKKMVTGLGLKTDIDLNINLHSYKESDDVYKSDLKEKKDLRPNDSYKMIKECEVDQYPKTKTDMILSYNSIQRVLEKWGIFGNIHNYKLLYLTHTILNRLNKGGSVILDIHNLYTTTAQKIIYLLSSMFETSFMYRGRYSVGYFPLSYLVLINYKDDLNAELKKKVLSDIEKALKEVNKCGKELQLADDDPYKKIYIDLATFNPELDKSDKFIIKMFSIKKNGKEGFFEELNKFSQDTTMYILDKTAKAVDFVELWDKYDEGLRRDIFKLSTFIKVNAYYQFAKKYKLKINKEVFSILRIVGLDKRYLAKTYFPYQKGLNFNMLKVSSDAAMKSYRPYLGNIVVNIIEDNISAYPKDMVITDANAATGRDTIYFAKKFKFVNVVEENKENCDIIKHNLEVYKIKNYMVQCEKYANIMQNLSQDIIFFQPDWAESETSKHVVVNTKMGKYYMYQIVNYVIFNLHVKYVVCKLPANYALHKYFKYINNNIMKTKVYNIYDNMIIIVNESTIYKKKK